MASTVTLFQNVLPTSIGSEQTYKAPAAAPLADRQRILFPPQQGANFTASGGTVIRFAIPAINKLVDTSAGVHFNYNIQLGNGTTDVSHMYMSEGASCVISRLRVLTSGDQQLEDLGAYNVWSRLNSNITVPQYMKTTALGISQGYAPNTTSPAASVGRGAPTGGSGSTTAHFSIPLHSMVLSNQKWLALKQISGLVIELTLAPARDCLIADQTTSPPTVPSYTITQASLSMDCITLNDGQALELDNAVRAAGGLMLTGKSYSVKYPQFANSTGSIVINDRHSSQTGLLLAFRANSTLSDYGQDSFQFAKAIDSAHVRNGGQMMSARPVTFVGNDLTEAFTQVLRAYGNHTIGEYCTQANFADPLGATSGTGATGKGSFMLAQTFETSSLVSGSATARKSGVDLEVITTGSSTATSFSAIAFVSYNKCVSFNIDGSVDVFD